MRKYDRVKGGMGAGRTVIWLLSCVTITNQHASCWCSSLFARICYSFACCRSLGTVRLQQQGCWANFWSRKCALGDVRLLPNSDRLPQFDGVRPSKTLFTAALCRLVCKYRQNASPILAVSYTSCSSGGCRSFCLSGRLDLGACSAWTLPPGLLRDAPWPSPCEPS